MSIRESYTAEEWAIISQLPPQAATAAAVADGVTVFGTIREIDEGTDAIEEGSSAYAGNALIAAILAEMAEAADETAAAERMVAEGGTPPPAEDDVDDLPIEAIEPMTDTEPEFADDVVISASPGDAVAALETPEVDPRDLAGFVHEVIANAMQAREILAAKSSPEEANAYKAWVLGVVERVINRTKQGGFLGIGGERVDTEEAQFRDELAAALG
jgi:hypothetical protein